MTTTLNTIKKMRLTNGLKLGAICAAVAAMAACSTTEAPDPLGPTGAIGRVRLVNLITDANRNVVNASLESQVFTVSLGFGQAAPANLPSPATAPYAPVYTGNRTFVLKKTADTTTSVATIQFSINENQDRSVYAVGGAGGGAVTSVVLTDDNPAAATTEARLRIVNMSPTAGAVDVFVTAANADLSAATARASSLAYQAGSAYFTVTPGTYQVRVVPAGTAAGSRAGAVMINLVVGSGFSGGTGRTIVLADNSAGAAPPMRAFVLTDR